jgi:uncharacterized protein with beta-barrel porin domain
MENVPRKELTGILRCLLTVCLLLAACPASALLDCTASNLTTTQRAVCDAAGMGNILDTFGANSTALQQMSTQSDIRLNSVAATTMSRDVQCIAAARNGASTAGCSSVAQISGPPQTREPFKPVGPYGLTVIGSLGSGEQDDAREQTGFDSQLAGLTAVLDYRFAQNLLAGVSLGYQKTELELNFNSGTLDSEAYRVALFVNYAPARNAFLQALVGFGSLKNDSDRVCSECGNQDNPGEFPTRNLASYDGSQVFASLGGGYLFPVATWSLGAYVRGDYVRTKTDGYTEKPTVIVVDEFGQPLSSNELQVDAQKVTSLTSAVGVLASYDALWGGVSVTPSARLEWGHEFEDDSRIITSRFSGFTANPTTPLLVSIATASPVRDWLIAGLGLRASFTRALGGFVDYSHLFKSDASYDLLSVGLRYEF